MKATATLLVNLLARTMRLNGCRLWLGSANSSGYPTVKIRARSSSPIYVHRLVCELTHGPIPAGFHVMHAPECCSPLCIEPAHLEAGTAGQNHLERYRRGANAPRGPGGKWKTEQRRQSKHLADL